MDFAVGRTTSLLLRAVPFITFRTAVGAVIGFAVLVELKDKVTGYVSPPAIKNQPWID